MENAYLYIKALHIIFVVTWFAGLFYIFRLFVYHSEALIKAEPDREILSTQFKTMERLLWKVIMIPSAVLTIGFGTAMLWYRPELLYQGFMQIKLAFVLGLLIYHIYSGRVVAQFKADKCSKSSTYFRMMNEVSTVILIAVVFLIVLQDSLSWVYGVIGILGVAVGLMIAIKTYKKFRER